MENKVDKEIQRLHCSMVEDLRLLNYFEALSDFFMVDYYTHSAYDMLPKSWLESVNQYGDVILKQFCMSLLPENPVNIHCPVMPLSMMCFIALIRKKLKARIKQPCSKHRLPISCKAQLKFLKPKKIVELSDMLPCIQKVITDQNITHVVDIGSGVGHASRFIAKQNPQCMVLRIEAQSMLINKATDIDVQFDKLNKPQNIFSSVCRLNLDDNVVSSFLQLLSDADNANGTTFACPESRILLLGLHPCGNLGSYMLRLFKECGICQSVVIVSCCYLFIDSEPNQTGGFPLSNFLKERGVLSLSGQLKEQACHNAEFYLSRLLGQLNNHDELSQNWRSIADIFLSKRESKSSRSWFKFKKRAKGENIIEFTNKNLVLHKLPELEKEEEELALKLSVVDQWKTWAYYLVYVLKVSLGVIGESIILNDRILFLLEGRCNSQFEILFDPKESSRNIAIVSSKTLLQLKN